MSRNYELMREIDRDPGSSVQPQHRAGVYSRGAVQPGASSPIGWRLDGGSGATGVSANEAEAATDGGVRCRRSRQRVQPNCCFGRSGSGGEHSRGSVSGRGKLSFPRTAQDVGHVKSPRPYRLAYGRGQYPIFCRADMERMPMAPLLGFTRGQSSQPFEIGAHEGAICRVTGDVRFPDRRCAAPITVRGCDRSGTTVRRNGPGSGSGVYSPEHGSVCSEEAALFQG